ncbi:MAG TPA: TonB-dependent receptor [Vicinamibacterales bacterium]
MTRPVRALAFVLALLAPAISAGQGTTARLVGTVKEPSGAVVPGATITAVNLDTGITREALTNEEGDYVMPNLPIGRYEVAAELTGFKRIVRSPVPLDVDQTARVDFELELGSVSETVEVVGAAPLVNSETSSLGQVIGETQVRNLPLNGRNFIQLGLLVPGTTPGTPGASTVPSRQGGVAITANGQRSDQNNWMLDGIDNNALFFGLAVIVPSTEAIEQFRVETSNYSAEFGRAAGAVVNLQIKSGTNQFHGTGYTYIRDDKLDTKNYFDTEKAPLDYNQFGASLGGPIFQNRTFFFTNYEGRRVSRGATVGGNVPTEAMRRGDFSGLPTIHDPATYDPGTNARQPFPNNQIPADRINPIAQRLLEAMPLPNSTDPARNYVRQIANRDDGDQFHLRVDHRASGAHMLMARYSHYNTDAANFAALPFSGDTQLNRHRGGVGQWTWIRGNVVNELRAGGNRYNFTFDHESAGMDVLSQFGLPFRSGDLRLAGYPGVSISGLAALGGNTAVPLDRIENTFQIQNATTWVAGDHSIKFGGDFRWYHGTNYQPQRARGQYSFTGVFTGQVGRTYNNGFADFLLGLPVLQQLLEPTGLTPNEPQNTRFNLFVQDDWKLSSTITLNLGLRYERDGAWTEANNRWGAFDLETGEVVYARDYDIPFSIRFPHRFADTNVVQEATNGFSPRVGVAWRPRGDAELVVRGAYGLFWSQTTGQDFINTSLQVPPGLIVDEQRSGSVVPELTFGEFGFGTDPSTLIPTVPGFIVIPYGQHKNPHVHQWNVGIEKQLGRSMAASISYVGNQGRDLQQRYQGNAALPPGPGPIQPRRRYPAFGALNLSTSEGWSAYNALQVKLERRFTDGLGFLTAYTWSKAMDQQGGEAESRGGGIQNPANPRASRGLAGFDLRHRFSMAVNYELPFGRGRRYLQGGVLGALLGGWHTSTIVSIRSGFPFSVVTAGDSANAGAGTVFADLIGDNHGNLPRGERTIDRWFDTSAFAAPAPFTFGNAGRNIVIGPGAATVDLSVARDFRVVAEHRLQFRVEAFNLFNRVNLGLPNSTVGNTAFGTIRSADSAREIQIALKYIF